MKLGAAVAVAGFVLLLDASGHHSSHTLLALVFFGTVLLLGGLVGMLIAAVVSGARGSGPRELPPHEDQPARDRR